MPEDHLVPRGVQEQLWQGLAEDGASGAPGEARAPKHRAQVYGLTPKRTSGFIKKQSGQTAGREAVSCKNSSIVALELFSNKSRLRFYLNNKTDFLVS